MSSIIILFFGGVFLARMLYTGWRLRRTGHDVGGKSPIARPLFIIGKIAMGLLWALALFQAIRLLLGAGGSTAWLSGVGAVIFAAGCCLALVAFSAIGRENRLGLPDGDCRLKTAGLYAWSRHPMYTGFYIMSLGAFLYASSFLSGTCLLMGVGIHHMVALAEERFMSQHFGDAWQDYADRVPRYGSLLRYRPFR